ncbi:MAG: hypothetical protein AAGE52_26255 [Myxococcota bacterium]
MKDDVCARLWHLRRGQHATGMSQHATGMNRCLPILAALMWFAFGSFAHAQSSLGVVGNLPPALAEELEWSFGTLVSASSAQEAFQRGARGVVSYDGQRVIATRPDGRSQAWLYVPSNDPQERALAETVKQWIEAPAVTPQVGGAPPQQWNGAQPPQQWNGAQPPQWNPGQQRPQRPRIDWREERSRQRRERPWTLRIAFAVVATPRDSEGLGPTFDTDADLQAYGGPGLRLTASRYLSPIFRIDLSLMGAYIIGIIGTQGPEGSLGASVIASSRGKVRWGGGVGIDALLVREVELGGDDHFGWISTRLNLIAEVAWLGRRARGVSLQVNPTFTYVPYAERFFPGFVLSAGFELPVGS